MGKFKSSLGVSLVVGLGLFAVLPGAGVSSTSAGGVAEAVLHTWKGQQGATYGGAVSELVDADGDNATDAIIGVPGHVGAAGVFDGQVEVRSGRKGTLIHLLQGPTGSRFGYSVADAGDVDGDRVHDIAVGAPGGRNCVTAVGAGRAYVFSGKNGSQLLVASGEAANDFFGGAIAAAGDVNRDGHDDVLVGAPCRDGPGGTNAGAAYVVSGKDASVLRRHDGAQIEDRFGWGAGRLDDVTGDRKPDYVVGAKDAGEANRGLTYVYDGRSGLEKHILSGNENTVEFGWFFVGSAGDVNRDRRDDVYVGDFCADDTVGDCFTGPKGHAYVFSGKTGELLHLFRGAVSGDGAGPGRSAGDVNRDGYDDVVVGSYTSSAAARFGGRVVVYSGRTGTVLFDYAGTIPGDTVGFDAVGLGDVNRDRRADLLVSAATNSTVYVVSTKAPRDMKGD
jgi:hypothetical protein